MLKPKNPFGDHYQLKKMIDSQGLAEVWEAVDINTDTNDIVALKIFPKLEDAAISELENIIIEQKNFEHHHLLPAKHIGIFDNQPYMEMQFCSNGTVKDKIGLLNEKDLAKCLYQTASALAFLHKQLMLHQCLKPENILIEGNNYFCYLPDLGFNNTLRQMVIEGIEAMKPNGINHAKKLIAAHNTAWVTPASYHAPELFLENAKPTTATDVWALGSIMYELATGKLPFGYPGGNADHQLNAIKDLPKIFSPNLNKLIKRCLAINPDERPSAEEIALSTANFFNTGSYKLSIQNEVRETEPSTNYPLIFLNEPPAQKSNNWKKISVGVLALLLIGISIYYFLNQPTYTNKAAPKVIVPKPLLNETVAKKKEILSKDSVILKDTNTNQRARAGAVVVNSKEKSLPVVVNKIAIDTTNKYNSNAAVARHPEQKKREYIAPVFKNIAPVKTTVKKAVKSREQDFPRDPGIPIKRDSEQKPN